MAGERDYGEHQHHEREWRYEQEQREISSKITDLLADRFDSLIDTARHAQQPTLEQYYLSQIAWRDRFVTNALVKDADGMVWQIGRQLQGEISDSQYVATRLHAQHVVPFRWWIERAHPDINRESAMMVFLRREPHVVCEFREQKSTYDMIKEQRVYKYADPVVRGEHVVPIARYDRNIVEPAVVRSVDVYAGEFALQGVVDWAESATVLSNRAARRYIRAEEDARAHFDIRIQRQLPNDEV